MTETEEQPGEFWYRDPADYEYGLVGKVVTRTAELALIGTLAGISMALVTPPAILAIARRLLKGRGQRG